MNRSLTRYLRAVVTAGLVLVAQQWGGAAPAGAAAAGAAAFHGNLTFSPGIPTTPGSPGDCIAPDGGGGTMNSIFFATSFDPHVLVFSDTAAGPPVSVFNLNVVASGTGCEGLTAQGSDSVSCSGVDILGRPVGCSMSAAYVRVGVVVQMNLRGTVHVGGSGYQVDSVITALSVPTSFSPITSATLSGVLGQAGA